MNDQSDLTAQPDSITKAVKYLTQEYTKQWEVLEKPKLEAQIRQELYAKYGVRPESTDIGIEEQ